MTFNIKNSYKNSGVKKNSKYTSSSHFPRRDFFLTILVYFAVQSYLLSFLAQEISLIEMTTKWGERKKEREHHFLNIASVTLLTTEAYIILKSGQTKLLRSKIVLYMLDTMIL